MFSQVFWLVPVDQSLEGLITLSVIVFDLDDRD